MPRRWLSIRGRREEQKSVPELEDNDFEFAFTAEPTVLNTDHSPTTREILRPTTSAGEQYGSKRRPGLIHNIDRPKSSDGHIRQSRIFPPATVEDPQIGLASGSPRHLPQVRDTITSTMNSAQKHHDFLVEGPAPSQATPAKGWKKLGVLFRPRATSNKEMTFYQVQRIDATDSRKLGLPLQRNRWRNPKSPLMEQECFDRQTSTTVEKDDTSRPRTQITAEHGSIPSLEVSIPGSPLDRYSVMFKDVNSVTQSGLLIRRSKSVNKLLLAPDVKQIGRDLSIPKLMRRATSPTTATKPDAFNGGGPSSTKYSLFPTTPKSPRFVTSSQSPNHCRDKSPGSVSQRSPKSQTLPDYTEPSEKCHSQQESHNLSSLTCKSHNSASDENSLPKVAQSVGQSRISNESEIFFDIRSFQDSEGQVGQKFEVMRPPSAVVQLARTKSNARKLQEKQEKIKDDQQARTTSVQIEETIALVESLTSPSSILQEKQSATEFLNMDVSDRDIVLPHETDSTRAIDTDTVIPKKSRRKSSLMSRLEGLNIEMPSPVIEAAEEATPRRTTSRGSDLTVPPISPAFTRRTVTSRSQESSPLSIIAASFDDVLTTESTWPPPPLPIKPSKFIPLSKYAPKHTTEQLIHQIGLQPARPTRSNTDNIVSYNARTSSLPQQRPYLERSSTMPPPNKIPLPQPKQSFSPPRITDTDPASKPSNGKETPMIIAYAKPAAEVSIARTISLSRKPSAKVTVGKLPARIDSRRIQTQTEVKDEVTEKNVSAERLPVVQEVHRRHKPGLSMGAIFETTAVSPTSPVPPMPVPSPNTLVRKPIESPPPPPSSAVAVSSAA